ncbi:MAG: hypothetical protein E7302_05835 [Butyrivibrio sp.]|nr:hypothetical protein [Butyrivibrio sp.]
MNYDNRKYKDTVFRELYKDKHNLLELFNAMNNTNYNNPDDLTVKTLEGNTYLRVKNDASFILDDELNLYEHQCTPCPNIPLRMLFYVTETLREMISLEDTYKETKYHIPIPRFVVFYNGSIPLPEKITYKLSDLFSKNIPYPELDLIVTVYNINNGHNSVLLDAANTLREYSIFVSKVRKYIKAHLDSLSSQSTDITIQDSDKSRESAIRVAITIAVEECIKENILHDFFLKHKQEAIDMSIAEYSFQKHIEVVKEDSYENGYNKAKDEDKAIIAEKDALIAKLQAQIDSQNKD